MNKNKEPNELRFPTMCLECLRPCIIPSCVPNPWILIDIDLTSSRRCVFLLLLCKKTTALVCTALGFSPCSFAEGFLLVPRVPSPSITKHSCFALPQGKSAWRQGNIPNDKLIFLVQRPLLLCVPALIFKYNLL